MPELDDEELWVLEVTFGGSAFPADIAIVLMRLKEQFGFRRGKQVLDSLVAKNVLSRSLSI